MRPKTTTNLFSTLAITILIIMFFYAHTSFYYSQADIGIMANTFPGTADGSAADPFIISSQTDLQSFRTSCTAANNYNGKFVELGDDIALSSLPASGWNAISSFRGTLDGKDHIISGFWINNTSDNRGLFNTLGANATIKNLNIEIENRGIRAGRNAGALAGTQTTGLITGCTVSGSGSVQGLSTRIGGLVGSQNGGTISDCKVQNISIIGINTNNAYQDNIGGIVGYQETVTAVTNCEVANITVMGALRVGGIVGGSPGSVDGCTATGITVSGTSGVGGIIGEGRGLSAVKNCLVTSAGTVQSTVTGSVSRDLFGTGGISGTQQGGTGSIENCTVEGTKVIGKNATGGIGGHNTGIVKNCSTSNLPGFDMAVTGETNVGGIAGYYNYAAGTVENCTASGVTVSGISQVGGVIGYIHAGNIKNVSVSKKNGTSPEVQGTASRVGGLLGFGDYASGTIDNCSVTDVTAIGANNVGGVAGRLSKMSVTSCQVSGQARSNTDTCGGLAGYADGNITECQADVDTTAITQYAGGLVGDYQEGTITDSSASGTVTCERQVGGFIGVTPVTPSSTIQNCHASGNVICNLQNAGTQDHRIGGFIGTSRGIISECYASGTITAEGGAHINAAGGFAGWAENGTITACYSNGNVEGTRNIGGFAGGISCPVTECFSVGNVKGDTRIGGFTGFSYSNSTTGQPVITNCYNICYVDGEQETGGFAGILWTSDMTNCYSSAIVKCADSDSGGAFIGAFHPSATTNDFTNCFYDGDIAGQSKIISNGTIDDVTGKTTEEMMKQLTFTGWDFSGIWRIDQDETYPYFLSRQNDADADHNSILAVDYEYEGTNGSISFAGNNKVAPVALNGESTDIGCTVINGNADRVMQILPNSLPMMDVEYPLTAIGFSNSGIGKPHLSGFIRKAKLDPVTSGGPIDPKPPLTTKPPASKSPLTTNPNGSNAPTGDSYNMLIYFILLLVAGMADTAGLVIRRKSN